MTDIKGKSPFAQGGELVVGFDDMDDAAVFRLPGGTLLVQTLDFFTPIVDDPYKYGQIAAANSLSDVYAMGGQPLMAANILCFPTCSIDPQSVGLILKGGFDKVCEAGAVLSGGHSVDDAVPKYGLSVIGTVDADRLTPNSGGRAGDLLYLTKPIGTGITLTAFKADLLDEAGIDECVQGMMTLNREAAKVGASLEIKAATDITGFGLAGHLHEVALASGVAAELYADDLPIYPQVLEFAKQGVIPAGLYRNRDYLGENVWISDGVRQERADSIFDPQTSGGLLMCVDAGKQELAEQLLKDKGMHCRCIGRLTQGKAGCIKVFADSREADIWR